MSENDDKKKKRLAQQLRANLARRKMQARVKRVSEEGQSVKGDKKNEG